MPYAGCIESVRVLNEMFARPFVLSEGQEMLARLSAGEGLRNLVVEGYTDRVGGNKAMVAPVLDHWPANHIEAVEALVEWALRSVGNGQPISVKWKGDTESPEIVTKLELREHELLIEFAHPPAWTHQVLRDIMTERRVERVLARVS